MKFTFRGKLVFQFIEDKHGRIEGYDGTRYRFDIGDDAFICEFILQDLTIMQHFLEDCKAVVNGNMLYETLKDVEVY